MTSFAELGATSTMVWATFPTNAFSSFSPLPRLLKLGMSAPRAPPHSRVAAHTTIRPLNKLLMRETPCGVNWERPIDHGETFPRGWDDEQGEETLAERGVVVITRAVPGTRAGSPRAATRPPA